MLHAHTSLDVRGSHRVRCAHPHRLRNGRNRDARVRRASPLEPPAIPAGQSHPLVPTGAPAEVPEAKWKALVADLAARGVSGEPTLVTAERVEFANGSLGCPQPGMSYTQALVDGYRVIVRADDRTFDYRFGRGDDPLLCER